MKASVSTLAVEPRLPAQLLDSAEAQTLRNAVAWGRRAPEAVLSGGRVLAPTGELLRLDVGIVGSRIAAVAEDLVVPGARRVKVGGKLLVPGYVDSHCHTLGPHSSGAYLGEALVRGTTYVTSDDAHAYGLLSAAVYPALLAYADSVPMVLRWSLRPEPAPRRLRRTDALALIAERPQVTQLGELATHPDLRELHDDLAALLAGARNSGARVEGHNPGASSPTLGVAAAAGATADHEAITAEEVVNRLRLGFWAFLRHNGLRPDVATIVPALLEAGVPLERTGLTVDGPTPTWVARHGMLESAIEAALEAGLAPRDAYAMATWRPATYVGLDGHLGVLAPGRIASVNVLADVRQPLPERVFSLGQEVARGGRLLVPMPEIAWEELAPAPWTTRNERLALDNFELQPDDPHIVLDGQAIITTGSSADPALVCVVFDPVGERLTRAAMHGWPRQLRALVSALTPERLLVAVGSSPEALQRCVCAVFDAGGGIGYDDGDGLHLLRLPVGGAITTAPFAEIRDFYVQLENHVRPLGHRFGEPVTTLLFVADNGLPGARFVAKGLIDVRTGEALREARPAQWITSPSAQRAT